MRRKKELFSVRVSAESAGTKNWGAAVSRAFGGECEISMHSTLLISLYVIPCRSSWTPGQALGSIVGSLSSYFRPSFSLDDLVAPPFGNLLRSHGCASSALSRANHE
jgi:hypothetical protein